MKRYAPNVQPLVSFSSFHTLRYKRYQFEFSYFRELFFWNNTLHFRLIQHDKSIFEAVLHGHEASSNRPFSSSKNSHFQNKAKCKYFLVKMNFICVRIKNHFLNKSFTLSLALKQSHGATLHFRDRRGAASLRYRNRAAITVVKCERKPYLVWFPCRCKKLSLIV